MKTFEIEITVADSTEKATRHLEFASSDAPPEDVAQAIITELGKTWGRDRLRAVEDDR